MSGDYDNDGWNGGRSHSGSSSKNTTVDAAKLTEMIVADGRLFGIKMPQSTIEQVEKFVPILLIWATERGQALATERFDPKVGKAVGFSIALSQQIISTVQNFYSLVTSLNKLHATMKPAAKAAGHSSALTMNNEAIEDLRSKIISVFADRMMDTAISTINAIPSLWIASQEVKAKSKSLEGLKALEETGGDPEKLADVLLNEHHGVGKGATAAGKKGITGAQIEAAERVAVDRMRSKYLKDFEEFKKKELDGTVKELKKQIEAIVPADYEFQRYQLTNKGLPLEDLDKRIVELKRTHERQLDSHYNYSGNDPKKRPKLPDDIQPSIKTEVESWKNNLTGSGKKNKALEHIAELSLKKRYARIHGPLDTEWKGYLGDEGKDAATRIDEFRKANRDRSKEQEQLKKETDSSKSKAEIESQMKTFMNLGSGVLAAVAHSIFAGIFGGRFITQLKKPLAAERVAYLAKVLSQPKDEPDWKPPERVPPMDDPTQSAPQGKHGREGLTETMGYTQYIHEIIQTHQNTRGRAEVGARFFEHFEKEAGWQDSKIQEMRDDELTPYEYAIKHVTKRILDGRLAVSALLELVANKQGNKIVQSDGHTFGPKGGGTDDATVKAGILKLIDEYSVSAQASKEITKEELSERKGKFTAFGEKDLAAKLDDKTVEAQQRAFMFRLYSDVIGSEPAVCKELGINSERCGQLRKECIDFSLIMDATVATLAQNLDDEKLQLTPEEKKLVTSLIELQQEKGGHLIDLTETPADTQSLSVLALNSMMLIAKNPSIKFGEGETPEPFWQSVKKQIEELKKPKEVDDTPASERNEYEDRKHHHKRNPMREHGDMEERDSHRDREESDNPRRDKHQHRDTHEHGDKHEHHEKKWAKDKSEHDGFGDNVRRRRAESAAEVARGGLT